MSQSLQQAHGTSEIQPGSPSAVPNAETRSGAQLADSAADRTMPAAMPPAFNRSVAAGTKAADDCSACDDADGNVMAASAEAEPAADVIDLLTDDELPTDAAVSVPGRQHARSTADCAAAGTGLPQEAATPAGAPAPLEVDARSLHLSIDVRSSSDSDTDEADETNPLSARQGYQQGHGVPASAGVYIPSLPDLLLQADCETASPGVLRALSQKCVCPDRQY